LPPKGQPAECVFCGTVGPWTRDHVPPKNLFVPRPNDLVTVPACSVCNGGSSTDDEYFRVSFVVREDLEENPDITGPKQAFLQRLQRNESRAFAASLRSELKNVERITPSGLYVDKKIAMELDDDRIKRIVQKTIKGLYANAAGARLPDRCRVPVWNFSDFEIAQLHELPESLKAGLILVTAQDKNTIGTQFAYWFFRPNEQTCYSIWLVLFYNAVVFLGLTLPLDEQQFGVDTAASSQK